jgi:predicted nucleic acid-binding protein
MVWTWLHEMEFRNAVRLQVFRKQINRRDSKLILHNQALGLETGVYVSSNPAGAEVCREVERLSNLYTSSLGTRTLDLLHVAQAIVLGVPQFLTFDVRQASAARAAGLDTPALLR